jgi:hypothetical protein
MKKLKDILRELIGDSISMAEIDTSDDMTAIVIDEEEVDELLDEYIGVIKSSLID